MIQYLFKTHSLLNLLIYLFLNIMYLINVKNDKIDLYLVIFTNFVRYDNYFFLNFKVLKLLFLRIFIV